MPYEMLIQVRQDWIRVVATGERLPGKEEDEVEVIWRPVANVCLTEEIDLILAIYNVSGPLPAPHSRAITNARKAIGWSRHFKLALVDLNIESRQELLLVEELAVSNGYQFRVFDNELKAEAWLHGSGIP